MSRFVCKCHRWTFVLLQSVRKESFRLEPVNTNECVRVDDELLRRANLSWSPALVTFRRKWCVSLLWMVALVRLVCVVRVSVLRKQMKLCRRVQGQNWSPFQFIHCSLFILLSSGSDRIRTSWFSLILGVKRDDGFQPVTSWTVSQAVCKLSIEHHRLYLDYLNEKSMYALYTWKYTYVLKGCLLSFFHLKHIFKVLNGSSTHRRQLWNKK